MSCKPRKPHKPRPRGDARPAPAAPLGDRAMTELIRSVVLTFLFLGRTRARVGGGGHWWKVAGILCALGGDEDDEDLPWMICRRTPLPVVVKEQDEEPAPFIPPAAYELVEIPQVREQVNAPPPTKADWVLLGPKGGRRSWSKIRRRESRRLVPRVFGRHRC